MKFSLIIATLGREKELYDLFESLNKQTYKNFEVIVIDQNKDDRVFKCVQKYMKILDIKYKKSLNRGVSYNRNIGIKLVEGDVVTFTDDDCTYNRELLENLVSDFNRFHDFNIICYEIVDKNNNKKLADFPDKITDINTKNIFKCAMSTSTFIKYKNINDLNFD